VQKFKGFKVPYILKQVLIVLTVVIYKGNRCYRSSEWRNHVSLRTLSRLIPDFTLPEVTKEGLEAFRTAMSFRFLEWLNHNCDVFVAYKAALGFVWA
jgi:hypothetical protein